MHWAVFDSYIMLVIECAHHLHQMHFIVSSTAFQSTEIYFGCRLGSLRIAFDVASHARLNQSAHTTFTHAFLFYIAYICSTNIFLSAHSFIFVFYFWTNTIMSSSSLLLFVVCCRCQRLFFSSSSHVSRNVNTMRRRRLGNGAFALFNLLFPKSPIKCFQSILLYFASLKFIRIFELNREVLQHEPHMFGLASHRVRAHT